MAPAAVSSGREARRRTRREAREGRRRSRGGGAAGRCGPGGDSGWGCGRIRGRDFEFVSPQPRGLSGERGRGGKAFAVKGCCGFTRTREKLAHQPFADNIIVDGYL